MAAQQAAGPRLTGVRLIGALLVPWLFVALYAFLYMHFLAPQIANGKLIAICAGTLAGLAFLSFSVAAVTFSRDVLTGRYPA